VRAQDTFFQQLQQILIGIFKAMLALLRHKKFGEIERSRFLQERIAPRMVRLRAWLRARNVPQAEERIQANAFFAATIAGDALAHMDENYSQDYFIERVEHMTEQSLFPSVYPRLSLGPGQRFASRGGYVLGFAQDGERRMTPLSDWIVP